MTKYKIPWLKKIFENEHIWKPGYIPLKEGYSSRPLNQSTIPQDKYLLKKLGITKGDKILAVAGNHGDWARAIMEQGCKVDYNEYSQYFISYVKKRVKFNKFIKCNFALLPKKALQYDWPFSYEPVSGNKAHPLSMLRSLLNRKGGIIMYYDKKIQEGKAKRYPKLTKILAKIYGCNYEIKAVKIDATRGLGENKGNMVKNKFYIFILKTNKKAREKVKKDIKFIEKPISNLRNVESMERLDKFSCMFRDDYLKEIKI